MGKRGTGWRQLAVLISHYTATPRPVVDRYTLREAEAERDAIHKVVRMLHGNARQ